MGESGWQLLRETSKGYSGVEMVNVGAESLAAPLLCEICLKGGRSHSPRELCVLAGEGEELGGRRRRVLACCAPQGRQPFSSALEGQAESSDI